MRQKHPEKFLAHLYIAELAKYLFIRPRFSHVSLDLLSILNHLTTALALPLSLSASSMERPGMSVLC